VTSYIDPPTRQIMDVDPPLDFGGFDAGGDFNFDLAGNADLDPGYAPIDARMASSPLRPYPRPKSNVWNHTQFWLCLSDNFHPV
jgi:hypothetical protein